MRGKLFEKANESKRKRITPPHAGKTERNRVSSASVTDHPRACGENFRHSRRNTAISGSPPRMRGKPGDDAERPCCPRITPAHAGKTISCSLVRFTQPDHPRACGENGLASFFDAPPIGSPPRMRGKQTDTQQGRERRRITPAHAGKTSRTTSCGARPTDHPRACGENTSEMAYFRG